MIRLPHGRGQLWSPALNLSVFAKLRKRNFAGSLHQALLEGCGLWILPNYILNQWDARISGAGSFLISCNVALGEPTFSVLILLGVRASKASNSFVLRFESKLAPGLRGEPRLNFRMAHGSSTVPVLRVGDHNVRVNCCCYEIARRRIASNQGLDLLGSALRMAAARFESRRTAGNRAGYAPNWRK